ncbi:hypothetical protein CRUP_027969 [Coryphaenoides rupestris]|nr:hypothetical protein CRUP_027969 [Coryphaenoides rupestris]
MLQDMFGEDCVHFNNKQLGITVDGCTVHIDPLTRAVVFVEGGTEDETFREMVDMSVQRLYDAINPVF